MPRSRSTAATDPSTTWATLFTRVSLAVNVLILVAVCLVLVAFSSSELVNDAWGPPTAGRGILLSVYFAILVDSVVLLWLHLAALLATQVLYKVTTPASAGTSNPVAICNLAVSALHAVTLALLWRQYKNVKRPRPRSPFES
jgi:hypothetical protein